MLVSHKYKFIFIKTIKTAGTSTEIFLEPYCIPDLGESHARQMTITNEGIVGNRLRQDRAEKAEFYNHMPPKLIRERIGSDVFNNYIKIANIRNPFDMLVSHYYFKPTFILYSQKSLSFNDYILKTNVVSSLSQQYKELLFLDEKFIIDEIIHYENLELDLNNLLSKLNLPKNERILSNYKENKGRPTREYKQFYSNETRQIIEDNFKFYLDKFNYTF